MSSIETLSIYDFLHKSFHKRIRHNTVKILKGEEFPPTELEFKNFKNQTLFVEAESNAIIYNNKKIVQSTFIEINNRIKGKTEAQEIKNLLVILLIFK